jgi:hypothetical protein
MEYTKMNPISRKGINKPTKNIGKNLGNCMQMMSRG